MRERLAVVWYFIRARYLQHFRTRKALRSYQKQRVLRQLAYSNSIPRILRRFPFIASKIFGNCP